VKSPSFSPPVRSFFLTYRVRSCPSVQALLTFAYFFVHASGFRAFHLLLSLQAIPEDVAVALPSIAGFSRQKLLRMRRPRSAYDIPAPTHSFMPTRTAALTGASISSLFHESTLPLTFLAPYTSSDEIAPSLSSVTSMRLWHGRQRFDQRAARKVVEAFRQSAGIIEATLPKWT
jgi:hypothetical protein